MTATKYREIDMHRRNFLATSTGLAAAAALPARANPLGQPIGLLLYTVGAELKADVPGTLKKVHDIGYRTVETAGFAGLSAAEFRIMAPRFRQIQPPDNRRTCFNVLTTRLTAA